MNQTWTAPNKRSNRNHIQNVLTRVQWDTLVIYLSFQEEKRLKRIYVKLRAAVNRIGTGRVTNPGYGELRNAVKQEEVDTGSRI